MSAALRLHGPAPLARASGAGFALLFAACGGGGAKAPAGAGPSDAGASSAAAPLATSAPPADLPPSAPMPSPGVAGSKVARVRAGAALEACAASSTGRGADPAALAKHVAEFCRAASKMRPMGLAMRGTQTDTGAHEERRFRAEAGRCYRAYVGADASVKDLVVVLRDAAGDVIAESPGPAVPAEGAACFTAEGEVTVLVGVGAGKGAWALEVWSD